MSPLVLLLRSRKFLLLVLDVLVSTILYVVAQFFPQAEVHVLWFIGLYQPIFIMLIGTIAYEDGKAKSAGNFEGRFD